MNTSAEFKERELKFFAAPESLDLFHILCLGLSGGYQMGAGVDEYWASTHPGQPLIRHRYNEKRHELTVKTQTVAGSNVIRNEVNLLTEDGKKTVDAFMGILGYAPVLKISKVSHIYYMPTVVLSWYSVMSLEGEILRTADGKPARFVEIELNEALNWEETFNDYKEYLIGGIPGRLRGLPMRWFIPGGKRLSKPLPDVESFCHAVLNMWAEHLQQKGIITQPPLKESLWEMFRPGVV